MSVFVDTNVLVAAALPREEHHERAKHVLESIVEAEPFMSDHVLLELWQLIERRRGWAEAMRLMRGIREAPLAIEPVTLADLERAQAIAERWADQRFDLVDCTSFAVMERLGCRRAATFDRDFAVYRYGADRTKAFEILS